MRKKCAFGIVEILADFLKGSGAKVAYLVRVQGFKNVFQRHYRRGTELSFQILCNKLLMFSHRILAFRFISEELSGISNGMLEVDPLAIPDNLVQDFSRAVVGFVDLTSQSNEEKDCGDDASITHLMNPPISTIDTGGSNSRPETQKVKLTPQDFVQDQVWAVYDDFDAMPLSYIKINYVFLSPITVSVTFLEPHPVHKKEREWVEEGLPIVCGIFRGIFRASKSAPNLEVSKFSHLAHCERISKGSLLWNFPKGAARSHCLF
ncbi:uncharacterized protein A4U43_C10F16020 [Asparagus officinalis]|uniref:DUF3444 domain-containing protein n=2 Tax=Asparagus officinalis TaxID=4686 RepID=A0A5P1E349_ASPOF|nr:uncharacterized protein A4U43_C10F16020 [Asparagus officinalis]